MESGTKRLVRNVILSYFCEDKDARMAFEIAIKKLWI